MQAKQSLPKASFFCLQAKPSFGPASQAFSSPKNQASHASLEKSLACKLFASRLAACSKSSSRAFKLNLIKNFCHVTTVNCSYIFLSGNLIQYFENCEMMLLLKTIFVLNICYIQYHIEIRLLIARSIRVLLHLACNLTKWWTVRVC